MFARYLVYNLIVVDVGASFSLFFFFSESRFHMHVTFY